MAVLQTLKEQWVWSCRSLFLSAVEKDQLFTCPHFRMVSAPLCKEGKEYGARTQWPVRHYAGFPRMLKSVYYAYLLLKMLLLVYLDLMDTSLYISFRYKT